MNVKQYLDHCNEQNWQVIEQGKRSLLGANKNVHGIESDSIVCEKSMLEARVQSLKNSITVLKAELLEEKAMWKKEVELMAGLLSSAERSAENEMITEVEMDVKSVASVPISADPLVTSPVIRDFEEKLTRYQGALAQAHAEKRLNMRRQIAANTYRKRLNEVEKLCQEELNKVRETATYLEPLKQMASEWSKCRPHYAEAKVYQGSAGSTGSTTDKCRRTSAGTVECCGGDFLPARGKETQTPGPEDPDCGYEVPVKQIDASLVMDEDASSEIKGKIVLQIGSLPSEVPTICYSAKFE